MNIYGVFKIKNFQFFQSNLYIVLYASDLLVKENEVNFWNLYEVTSYKVNVDMSPQWVFL